jgi:hypothetical protein
MVSGAYTNYIGAGLTSAVLFIVPMALWLLFFFIDRDIIKNAGGDPPSASDAIGILLIAAIAIPVYLYNRSKSLGKPLSSFYVSIIVMVFWLLLTLPALFS